MLSDYVHMHTGRSPIHSSTALNMNTEMICQRGLCIIIYAFARKQRCLLFATLGSRSLDTRDLRTTEI
jgi:hypothetical protein